MWTGNMWQIMANRFYAILMEWGSYTCKYFYLYNIDDIYGAVDDIVAKLQNTLQKTATALWIRKQPVEWKIVSDKGMQRVNSFFVSSLARDWKPAFLGPTNQKLAMTQMHVPLFNLPFIPGLSVICGGFLKYCYTQTSQTIGFPINW